MTGYTKIHIPRNVLPLLLKESYGVLVTVNGQQQLVQYGETVEFQVNDQAIATIFMGKHVKKIQECVFPNKTYTIRLVEMIFDRAIVELVEI